MIFPMRKALFYTFAVLIFFVPIVLWPYTSEVFEFNKMVLVYALTTLIAAFWAIRCVIERKFIFRRTILDIPLLIFFVSQTISTFISIDFYTSVFGYYSRFNGGLLSTLSYLILYWAFVSNIDGKEVISLIKIWLGSAVLVSIYAVLEHFGIDKSIWVQDVQSRVFSTLGQPNWLAAWVTALIPVAWAFAIKTKVKSLNFWVYFGISVLFFWTLIFTKSRSGFLGFGVATIIFWAFVAVPKIKKVKSFISPFLIIGISFVAICLISGTQWTPSIHALATHEKVAAAPATNDTALETGGTESGIIREIVWTGAIKLWQHYPIFGTGVETFGYSYYLYRPAAHNLTSEWDFIYNKAHNEFLNFAANSGTVGLLSYLGVIGFTIYLIYKAKTEDKNLNFALIAGYISLSISNFFGFSVVPTQLQFFLFPAVAFAITNNEEVKAKNEKSNLGAAQKVGIPVLLLLASYLLFLIFNYWQADVLYNRGKAFDALPRPDLALAPLTQAIKYEPSQAIYYGELSTAYAEIAMAYDQAHDATDSARFTDYSVASIQNAVNLSPSNVNLRRTEFGIFIRLSVVNEKYLVEAKDTLLEAIKLAPTDAKLYYNLGIAEANLGNYDSTETDFKNAISLKSNYTEARIEYAALLVHLHKPQEAKDQLNYVLKYLDPGNSTAKQALANIK